MAIHETFHYKAPWNNEMNITLKRIGLIVLLVAGVAGTSVAVAQSRYQDHSFGFFAQDGRQRPNAERRGAGNQQRDRRNNEREARQRRDDRLSPDERRTLRQQIDEAGRDIYAPRRR